MVSLLWDELVVGPRQGVDDQKLNPPIDAITFSLSVPVILYSITVAVKINILVLSSCLWCV